MYKVKRFSQLSVDERQFNLASDLYHSGVKRTWKKYVGRGRKGLARKIDDHLAAVEKKSRDARAKQLDIANLKTVGDPNLRAKALLEAEANGAKVITSSKTPGVIPLKHIDESKELNDVYVSQIGKTRGDDVAKEVLNAKKSDHDYAIFNNPVYGAEGTFHEVEHVKNANGRNGLFNKIISNLNSSDSGSAYRKMVKGKDDSYKTSRKLKDVWGLFKAGKVMRLEESNASRAALKSMKKSGASKENLEVAKSHLDNAGDVYAEAGSKYWYPIKNATLGNMKLK